MPPYAGDSVLNMCNVPSAYADVAPTKPEEQQQTAPNDDATDASAAPRHNKAFEALLDFNPCVSMADAGTSMTHMFKTRTCTWCGKGCNKIKGYNKEIVEGTTVNEETGEEEPTTQKIYYHKWCGQLKEWKETHSEGWKNVMEGLIGHFRAIELAEQRRIEAEERARREAIEKARREAEEKVRREAEEKARREAEEQQRQMDEEARAKKETSFKYKMGKKLKKVKKAVTSGCKSKKAADESATEHLAEQYPENDL